MSPTKLGRNLGAAVLLVLVVLVTQQVTDDSAELGPERLPDAPTVMEGATFEALLALPVPSDAATWTAEVVHVSDGDTLIAVVRDPGSTDLSEGQEVRVRLLRVDTPEEERETTPAECWSAQAQELLEALLPDGTVATFRHDVEAVDRFGRELAHVWTPDGIWVNGEIVARGAGTMVTFRPNVAHGERIAGLEAAARAAGLGLWGNC